MPITLVTSTLSSCQPICTLQLTQTHPSPTCLQGTIEGCTIALNPTDFSGKKLAHQTRMSKSEESVYIALGEQCISSAVEIYRSRKTEDSIIRTHIMENIVKVSEAESHFMNIRD